MRRLLLPVLALLLGACAGPLGPFAGGALSGIATEPATDWTFVNDIEVVQLETLEDGAPHSVNTWIGAVDGQLYVPTSLIMGSSEPMDRQWVKNVEQNSNIRLRIEDRVYEFKATRLTDETQISHVRTKLLAKYEVTPDDHAVSGWIYLLVAG